MHGGMAWQLATGRAVTKLWEGVRWWEAARLGFGSGPRPGGGAARWQGLRGNSPMAWASLAPWAGVVRCELGMGLQVPGVWASGCSCTEVWVEWGVWCKRVWVGVSFLSWTRKLHFSASTACLVIWRCTQI